MLGALPETREDIEATYQFVKKLRPTSSLVFIFMPLPGSELFQEYIDHGYRFDYDHIRSDKAVFPSAGLTMEELEIIRDRWYHDFNQKPNLLIRGINSIREIRSWNDVKHIWGKVTRHLTVPKDQMT